MEVREGIPDFKYNSARVAAKSFLTGNDIIEVFVESEMDTTFWRKRFKEQNIENVEVKPARKINGSNGKDELISSVEKGRIELGSRILIAVDSDYDNFMYKHREIYNSDFVFQTYAYSIESFYYCPSNVISACEDATNSTIANMTGFNIELIFKNWSVDNFSYFMEFVVNKCSTSRDNIYKALDELSIPSEVPCYYQTATTTEFSELKLDKDNIFYFINGHKLESKIKSLVDEITKKLLSKEKESIQGTTEQATKDMTANLYGSTSCPISILKSSCLDDHPLMEFITRDINKFKKTYIN